MGGRLWGTGKGEEEWGRGNVVDVVFYDGGCFKGCLGGGMFQEARVSYLGER